MGAHKWRRTRDSTVSWAGWRRPELGGNSCGVAGCVGHRPRRSTADRRSGGLLRNAVVNQLQGDQAASIHAAPLGESQHVGRRRPADRRRYFQRRSRRDAIGVGRWRSEAADRGEHETGSYEETAVLIGDFTPGSGGAAGGSWRPSSSGSWRSRGRRSAGLFPRSAGWDRRGRRTTRERQPAGRRGRTRAIR